MEVITLNLIPGGATQIVHASQFDVGRQFKLVLYNGDEPFNPSTYVRTFRCIKPDGNIVEANVSADSTSVTVTTTEQMCAVEGDTICELRLDRGSALNPEIIGSANFILRVEMDPIFKGTSSQSEGQIYDTLQWLKDNKEDRLLAGNNVQVYRYTTAQGIPTTRVSATDTTYSAGDHISITGNNNTISTTFTAGPGITITGEEIADVPYTAGAGINISANREISADIATLPIASTATLGCIKVGDNLDIISDGTLSAILPIASTATLGCIKVGANLGIDPDGTLSATGGGGGGGDYLAGDNIQISDARRISATDTTYTAGNYISITGTSNEISVLVQNQVVENSTQPVQSGAVYSFINSTLLGASY